MRLYCFTSKIVQYFPVRLYSYSVVSELALQLKYANLFCYERLQPCYHLRFGLNSAHALADLRR
jgi:hypothetical protein